MNTLHPEEIRKANENTIIKGKFKVVDVRWELAGYIEEADKWQGYRPKYEIRAGIRHNPGHKVGEINGMIAMDGPASTRTSLYVVTDLTGREFGRFRLLNDAKNFARYSLLSIASAWIWGRK